MSARKSFDVRRKAPQSSAKQKAARRRTPVRSRTTKPARGPRTLAARRREARNRSVSIVLVLIVIAIGALIYVLWRPELRIQEVKAKDQSLIALAEEALSGTYGHVIPRDSIFFFPEKGIRAAILDAHPEISALSVSRAGLTSISIHTISRTAAFWWCGTPESATAANTSCYEADAEGMIFRPAIVSESASSTQTALTLRIYADIVEASSTPQYPLKAKMKRLDAIPDVLLFVKAMKEMNVSPVSVAIRGDEADLFVPSSGRGTRITYVLGREEAAAALASAVFPGLNLTDGSIEYVDLRFAGKAYIKRRE